MTIRATILGTASALAVSAAVLGCPPGTGAQVNAADTVAEDWTHAICTVLAGQPLGQPAVDLICSGILIAEGTVGQLTQDGGPLASTAAVAPATKTVILRHVPADQAALLLARHPASGVR